MGSVSNSHKEVRVYFVCEHYYYAVLVTSVGCFCKLHVLFEDKLQVRFICLSSSSPTKDWEISFEINHVLKLFQ